MNERMNEKLDELMNQLTILKLDLSSSVSDIGDWKIIKIYEARMKNEPDPYNFDELSAKRQAVRDKINEIQKEISELSRPM